MRDFVLNLWWGWQLALLFGVPIAALLLAVTINDWLDPAAPHKNRSRS